MDTMPVLPQLSRSSSSDETKFSLPRPLKKFYLGEPLALGITQILIAIIGMAFGILMDITEIHFLFSTPYWTGVLYIISGSLSVAAARNPKMSLVKGMLGMNVVSAVGAGISIVVLSLTMLYTTPRWHDSYMCEHYEIAEEECLAKVISYDTLCGMQVVILVFIILEFCISISTAAFGCKTVCRDAYSETVVVLYQNMTPINATSQTADSKDPEALWTQLPSN
ncbi:membrane-spanning 4-domains subfamily A member 4A-like [Sceloporus undulatus]|uniref:membrane-spanning 4-domains subfamily A member 4A-like n=1 Tax=Sceloporus undulatus TaxID=8520 RepID=UPI001C4DC7B8|nr:membrane-spanning 4-domains subfamily A member 4A-like [Sceloporus undulatus]XP_042296383.1 membrane-spanning 4-domains subfamily A member 4A-like [Sceloporus undulatus]